MTSLFRKTDISYDAVRKNDLKKIKLAFEDYYNDHQSYPLMTVLADFCNNGVSTDNLSEYLQPIPCDPKTGEAYLYLAYPNESDRTGGYRVLTKLSRLDDPDSARLGCDGENGCGVGDDPTYNYGVSEGIKVSIYDPNAGEPNEPITGTPSVPTATPTAAALPTPTPTLPPASLCDLSNPDSVCYTCSSGNCNICHNNLGAADSCPTVGSYSTPEDCVLYTSCQQ